MWKFARSLDTRQALSKLFCVMRKKWSLKTTVTQNAMLELEQNLVKWVHIMRENKILLSGPMVQEKAIEFF